MAVCEVWDVKGRLDHPINYAMNKDKTTSSSLSPEDLQGLKDVMNYAANSSKTTLTDEQRFVSAINCNIATARQDMLITKKQWNDRKQIVAFHGFQSFKEGEVTPEIAHEIGLRLAETMWGDRFEVVVATHLNTHCLHNHFVINSTSFKDGKRFYDNKAHLKKFRAASDKLCKEYQLSVIKQPDPITNPRFLYQADKAGMPTRHNVLMSAIDDAIAHSFTKDDFFKQMTAMGYRCDFRESRKYATIIPKGYDKPIRIHRLGEAYTRERIFTRIQENHISARARPIAQPLSLPTARNITPYSIEIAKKKGGLQGLYLHYCYRLGIIPKRTKRNNSRMHYLLKEDLLKLEAISKQTQLLYNHKINTIVELKDYETVLTKEQEHLIQKRRSLWNQTRRISNPEQLQLVKSDIATCSSRLKDIRQDLKSLHMIEQRSETLHKNLTQITNEELQKEKENPNYEPFRRRSGTDCANEPRRL